MLINQENFQIACANAELKVTQAVKQAGVNVYVLGRIKNGKAVTPPAVGKLAKVLGCDVTFLIEK